MAFASHEIIISFPDSKVSPPLGIDKVYPNPVADNMVYFDFGNTQKEKILSIYNSQGQLAWHGKVNAKLPLHLPPLANGLYVFTLEDLTGNGSKQLQKIVINSQ